MPYAMVNQGIMTHRITIWRMRGLLRKTQYGMVRTGLRMWAITP